MMERDYEKYREITKKVFKISFVNGEHIKEPRIPLDSFINYKYLITFLDQSLLHAFGFRNVHRQHEY
jgi:hypothetical protein